MNIPRDNSTPRSCSRLLALVLALALAACGGGGGSPGAVGGSGSGSTGGTGAGGPVTGTPTVGVSFVNSSGQASNALSASSPLVASATVRDKAGKPVPNALVVFATDNTLVLFSPSAGTALTDAKGVASVTLRPASLAAGGAGKVTATTTIDGATVTGEANVAVGATALALGPLTLAAAQIDAYGSTVVSVDVTANGARYADEQLTVNFSSTCAAAGKATLAASARTVNGIAQAVFRDLGCGATDTLSASIDGVARPSSAQLQIAAPAAASVQFVSAEPVGQSIVIKGQGGIGRTETATVKFKVVDIFNRPLSGKTVSFSVFPADVTLNKASDTTDQNGEVITTVNSGSLATTFRVKATLDGGISTFSDSIVVTSGLPVQRALSFSSNITAVEAAYDNTNAATFSILLADQFGNPVADGTPVAFQTNMGAIGSADKGGCNTVNGGCSVPFRTQNPRTALPNTPVTACNSPSYAGSSSDSTRPGLATICASTTDGSNILFAKRALFFSGSFATNVYLGGTRLSGAEVDLGSVQFEQSSSFTLEINDANNNPMPTGTTVAVSNPANAKVVDVLPSSIQNIFPHDANGADDPTGVNVSGRQGSLHRITVAGTITAPCTGDRVATFSVVITTPKGNVTSYPFRLKFTCS
ncbi:MAG: Ig-like domain-containing protein [Massilia sp.]